MLALRSCGLSARALRPASGWPRVGLGSGAAALSQANQSCCVPLLHCNSHAAALQLPCSSYPLPCSSPSAPLQLPVGPLQAPHRTPKSSLSAPMPRLPPRERTSAACDALPIAGSPCPGRNPVQGENTAPQRTAFCPRRSNGEFEQYRAASLHISPSPSSSPFASCLILLDLFRFHRSTRLARRCQISMAKTRPKRKSGESPILARLSLTARSPPLPAPLILSRMPLPTECSGRWAWPLPRDDAAASSFAPSVCVGAAPALHWRCTGAALALHSRSTGAALAQHWSCTGAALAQRWRSTGVPCLSSAAAAFAAPQWMAMPHDNVSPGADKYFKSKEDRLRSVADAPFKARTRHSRAAA